MCGPMILQNIVSYLRKDKKYFQLVFLCWMISTSYFDMTPFYNQIRSYASRKIPRMVTNKQIVGHEILPSEFLLYDM